MKSTTDELRRRQRKALWETAGILKAEDHPELKDGAAVWIHELREADKAREQERLSTMRPPSAS